MGMPASQPITTIEALLSLPDDGQRHELLDGDHVVTPAPRPDHERAVGELLHALQTSVRDLADFEVFGGPADIRLSPRTLVQPDLFVVRSHRDRRFRRWEDAPTPLLAVEVLSPRTAARDRGTKRRLYLESGVEEYWIVDLDARLVERWRAGDERPEIVDGALNWSLSGGASGRDRPSRGLRPSAELEAGRGGDTAQRNSAARGPVDAWFRRLRAPGGFDFPPSSSACAEKDG